MYAIFQSGGKQHLVSEGKIVRLEKLNIADREIIEFTEVLMIVNHGKITVGFPFIKGSIIKAQCISHGRSEKIKIVKFRRRKHYRKQQSHRQWFTDMKIISIITNIE